MKSRLLLFLTLITYISIGHSYAMENPPVGNTLCTYTLYLTDSYGDGWNGASVRVTDMTTEEYTDYTIDFDGWYFFDENNETDTFTVIVGHQYSLSWNSGQYDHECSFSLRDNLGELIYEYDPYSYDPWDPWVTPQSGTTLFVFTAICTDSMCSRPSNLRMVSHTPYTATLQWTNGDTSIHLYKLLYGTNEDPDSMFNVTVNDTTYTLTNLSPDSIYHVQLSSICDTNTYSRYFQTIDVFNGYCIPLVDMWYGSFLRHLSFGNIPGVMIDTVNAYEYADRHNQIGSCAAGDTLNISATFEYEVPKIFVWVDWNNNYQFEQNELIASDLNTEEYYYYDTIVTRQLSYYIPSTCPLGNYRLRLITTYIESDIPDPCLYVLDARDYTLQVTSAETLIRHIYIDSMEHGTISINGNQYFPSELSVENGSTITISAVPNPNYSLQYLIVNNDTVNSPYSMIVTNDVYIQASFVLTLPDLHVTSIINSTPVAGGNFTVEWTVKNDGYGATPQGRTWYDYLFLVSDTEVQLADSIVMHGHLGTFQNLQSLNTGQYYTNSASVTIPQDLFGNYYLFVLSDQAEAFDIDFTETGGIAPIPYTPNVSGTPYHYFLGYSNYNDSITEIEENDNFFYKMITIQPPPSPDLSVTHVSHPIDAFSNTDIPISWTVSNQGQVTATGRWRDKVYIQTSASNSLSNAILLATIERSDTLPAGNTYQASTIVHIPISYMGDYYIVVATDAENDVYESIYENNNSMCSDRAISVVLSPLADLMATSITVADTVAANTSTIFQWNCSNEGLSATETNRWYDAIYFSEDSTLDVHSDIRIEAILHRGILEMDSSYHVSANVRIPNLVSGQYYIFVKVDDIESVYEYINEPNNVIRRQQPIFVTQPDFSATSVTIPDTGWSGRDIQSTFILRNVGESDFSGEIPVKITIMNDQDSTFLFDGPVSVNIPIDDSTLITQTLRIPQGQSGDYYCHVYIGHMSSVIELSYSNNHAVSSSPLHINLSPYPDLMVSNIEAPDTVNTGQSIQINYIIENHGNDMANGYNTSQILFYRIPDGACYIIPSSDYQWITVAPDTQISYYQTGIIPSNIPAGSYNVSVKVDANDVFYEYNGENNNTGTGDVCVVNMYPQDLQLLQIDGPDTVTWGQTAQYIMHVKNNSFVPTLQNRWSDKLKLVLGSNEQSVRSSHQGVLLPDSVYENTISIIIPYGSPASASIEAIVDDDYVNPDINRNNNQLSKNVAIRSVPTSDLVVTNVEVLDPPISGQPIRIAYTVINMGQDSIVNKAWTDALFLSKAQAHDSIGPEVKTKSQHRTLRVGESYRDTISDVQVRIPNHGLYYVMVNANKNKNYYESRWENNIAHCSINVTLPPPGDLIVRDITHLDTVLSGNNINATWTIVNIGVDSIRGRGLSTLVYLSQDTLFDVNDKRIGTVENDYTEIAPNDSIVQSFSGRLSGIAEGDYHLIVKTDVRNVFYEDSDDNNDAVGINTVHIKVKELLFDSLLSDSLYNNLPNDYVLRTREYQNETARIQVNSQDSSLGTRNTIYVKHNGAGSNLNYTYSSIAQNNSSPYLYIPHTRDSLYYVSVYGVAAAGRQDISIEANILSFELNEINPTESGNNGNITLELLGSHFRPDMKVFLTKNNDTIYANKIIYNNYYQVFAKFTFNHIDTGYYNIGVLNFCEGENMLAHAFHVTDNSFEDISYNMIYPASPRSNKTISMVLEFGNIGNMDIVSPIIEITSAGGSYIALSADELNEKKQILQIPLNIEGEPQGVLRPGKIGHITIYGYTAGQLSFLIKRVK